MSSETESYSSKYVLIIAIKLIVIAIVLAVFSGKVIADQEYDYPMPIEEMKNLTPEPRPVTKRVTRKKYKTTRQTKRIRKKRSINKSLPTDKKKGGF